MTGSNGAGEGHALHRRSALVAGIPFQVTTLSDAVEDVLSAIADPASDGITLRFANAYSVAEATRDRSYKNLLRSSGINFPDGTPVSWYMRRALKVGRTGRHVTCRPVRGPSFFEMLLDKGRRHDLRHFLLGASEETLALLTASIQDKYPGAVIVGSYSPPFGPLDETFYERSVEAISPCSPNFVWVALGAPKQDFASAELSRRLQVSTAGVGAAFDFLAGTASEAPEWIRNSGLEWVFRLATEPRRLWKRYLFGNPRFVVNAERALWKMKRAKA
ncbi:putative N-acetylglucosaminyldiphosphoundecaprenol N-acetyl-beta-D-mannosaminyltransferase [Rhodococcus sp. AW25M09]|uniref:WecB/TagA/CpsF family glycosyltransferase n=1 Tax=Rhodococcus sp. AW25M09 TaxID=1268303 RepID=UPI0002AC6D32|nr:WecB/TagA/CpsF family glycosyltransferase [Rhodococcus sp. AW25M09]CCQ13637.1 putative N-acetylglucosaminyldiphosphoundecaprenol N-acetyl-beta-D-mannosaminyltransferase [Rhodococcus sp. AW25M09]